MKSKVQCETCICETCLESDKFPSEWKKSFESVIFDNMADYFADNNLIPLYL